MMEAFEQGADIHVATAARVFGVPRTEVTREMRRTAKMVNFGIIFGISSFGLAQRLGIARMEGAKLIDEYFVQYPGVKAYMDRTIVSAKEHGFVETMAGRRRWFRDINSSNAMIRRAAERTAINTPIQGSAADMIKLAMVSIASKLHTTKMACRMLLQVHDELIFELPEAELDQARQLVGDAMRDALPLSVPVLVEMGHGLNWYEAHS